MYVELFLDLIYTNKFEEKNLEDIIYVMEICVLFKIKDLVNYCFQKIELILNKDNFVQIYTKFIQSDIINPLEYNESLLFDNFYFKNQEKIQIKDKLILKTLKPISMFQLPKYQILSTKINEIKDKLFENLEISDFIIESNDNVSLKLHKCILGNLEYFKKLFLMNKDESKISFDYSNFTLFLFFKFIYKGVYEIPTNLDNNLIMKILLETYSFIDQICLESEFKTKIKEFILNHSNNYSNFPSQDTICELLMKNNTDEIEKILFDIIKKNASNTRNGDVWLNHLSRYSLFLTGMKEMLKPYSSKIMMEMYERVEKLSEENELLKKQKN